MIQIPGMSIAHVPDVTCYHYQNLPVEARIDIK